MSRVRTFRHRFRGGITATLTVDLDRLAAGEHGYLSCEWSKRPKPRTIPEYRRWMLAVYQHLANETGLKAGYGISRSLAYVLTQAGLIQSNPPQTLAAISAELARKQRAKKAARVEIVEDAAK